jgi:drug/metabolite transporter (DMT)-like permease
VNTAAYALVLVSAFTHAYWNFLLKRSGGGQSFVGMSKIGEVVLFAPVFLAVGLQPALRSGSSVVPLVVVGSLLSLANYVALALAYDRGEMSIVYPVSRGAILLFLPVLGYVALGERMNLVGGVALFAILLGIVALQLTALRWSAVRELAPRIVRSAATGFALLAALAAACYTLWDKHAVTTLPPFTYFYLYTAGVAVAYAAYLARRIDRATIRRDWATHRAPILQVSVLNTVTYLLVLFALRTGTSSYVIALRQLSIAIGVLLGAWLLGEDLGPPKRVGVALILGGCLLVAFAR